MKKKTVKPPTKPSNTPPKRPLPTPTVPKLKGIDSMTVEELKAALKKRKLKGLTGIKREQLVEKLKKEVKAQRTLGGGGGRRMTLGKVGEEKGGEKVQDKVVRLEEKEESEGGDEEAKRIRSRSEDKKEGGATKVSREVQGEDERHGTEGGGAAKEENVLEEEMIRMKLEEEEEEGVEKVQGEDKHHEIERLSLIHI